MKQAYTVTEAAGRDVAGIANPGADKTVMLTPSQAEHALRIGHLRLPTDHDGDGKMGGSAPRAPKKP